MQCMFMSINSFEVSSSGSVDLDAKKLISKIKSSFKNIHNSKFQFSIIHLMFYWFVYQQALIRNAFFGLLMHGYYLLLATLLPCMVNLFAECNNVTNYSIATYQTIQQQKPVLQNFGFIHSFQLEQCGGDWDAGAYCGYFLE